MKLLLDTHLLLWAAAGDPRLPAEAVRLLEDPDSEPMFSVASLWEVAIKQGLGRIGFRADAGVLRRGLLDNGYLELPILATHVLPVAGLPDHHKDPFDRLLVAQAQSEGITLLTVDPQLARYPGPVRLL